MIAFRHSGRLAFLIVISLVFGGCAAGLNQQEKEHEREGVVAGTISDTVTGTRLHGAHLDLEPSFNGTYRTDPDGEFYAEVPPGTYRARIGGNGYRTTERTVEVRDGSETELNVRLEPTAAVILDVRNVEGAKPGSAIILKPTVIIRDGSTLRRISFALRGEAGSAPAQLATRGDEAVVTLPDAEAFKQALLYELASNARLPNRWMIVGMSPSDLKEAGKVVVEVTAETSSGIIRKEVTIIADLSPVLVVNPGIRNVPINRPVLLHAPEAERYGARLVAPPGSSAVLSEAATQHPAFTPDVPGLYRIMDGETERLNLYAGTWHGNTVAVESPTLLRWLGHDGCNCHAVHWDRAYPKFTLWAKSGHAEIFNHNIKASFRYKEACLSCHSVGFDRNVRNSGADDVDDFAKFLQDPQLWDLTKQPPRFRPRKDAIEYVFENYPNFAKRTNIQCEHCHGPNDSLAHQIWEKRKPWERVSHGAEVCCQCHDEGVLIGSLHHTNSADLTSVSWRKTRHANYNIAIEVATVEKKGEQARDCGRCHSAGGFLEWTAAGEWNRLLPQKDALVGMGMTEETVHPVTCAVCHEPHYPGNSFRAVTEKVPPRLAGRSFLPSDFGPLTGGRGDGCAACHSSRVRMDVATEGMERPDDAAPHSPQADLLFGRSARLVPAATPNHGKIEDTCIWCHMKPVPKPSPLGYPRGDSRHTFAGDRDNCGKCHERFSGEDFATAADADIEELKGAVEEALRRLKVRGRGGTAADAIDLVLVGERMGIETATADGKRKLPLADLESNGRPLLQLDAGKLAADAAWNYFLLKRDGSHGIHNPLYTNGIIKGTLERLRRTGG